MLKFGWAETDITPKKKISLSGEFFERVTNDVETPIYLSALAIDNGSQSVIFCNCDLTSISEDLTEEVSANAAKAGINPESIIISAGHVHNSYTYSRRNRFPGVKTTDAEEYFQAYMPADCVYVPEESDPNAMPSEEARSFLVEAVTKTVIDAWNNRQEGGYATGFGRAAVGMNRRACYTDGTAKMWGDVDTATFSALEGGNDNGVEMLFVYDKEKKLTGVVANICCPAQVMEQRNIISSDYWGKLRILLREKYGKDIYLLPLCGPAGDQCPRDLIRWVEPETPIKDPNVIRNNPKFRRADPSMFDINGTWKIGRRILNEIEMALEEVEEIHMDAPLLHTVDALKLPLRKVTDADIAEAKQKMEDFFKGRTQLNYMDSAALYIYTGVLQRAQIQEKYNVFPVQVHTVRLGDVAFSTSPFELFLDFGNQIRARSDAAQTFLIQLANGAGSYLPTEKAEKAGHYSAYVSSGYVGHEGGELLVDASLDAIHQLFE